MDIIPADIKVIFKDHFPVEMDERLCETEFVGLSTAYRGDDPRVLYLQPSSEQYQALKATLEELEVEGALSFIEEFK